MYGERRGACRVLVTEPERKIPPGRLMRKLEDNIKIDFEELGWAGAE
jgi:hypothetical protein